MNDGNTPLDRLLRAAARSPREATLSTLPFPVEARVLAAWRSSRSEGSGWIGLWLRTGLAGAAVALALTLAVTWSHLRPDPEDDEYAVANATLYVAVSP